MGSRHSGITLAAGADWTVINHYYNKADSAATIIGFGHAWYRNCQWRLKVNGELVPDYQPNPFLNQFGTLPYSVVLNVAVPPQGKFEVEAKNSDSFSHIFESILVYDGVDDLSALEGTEITSEPAIQQSALTQQEIAVYYPTNTLQWSHDAEVTTTGTYVKVKEIMTNKLIGKLRIKFDIKATTGYSCYGQIYKNGVALGTERTTTSTTYVTFTEDLDFGKDTPLYIQLYMRVTGGTGYARNFRIYGDILVASQNL